MRPARSTPGINRPKSHPTDREEKGADQTTVGRHENPKQVNHTRAQPQGMAALPDLVNFLEAWAPSKGEAQTARVGETGQQSWKTVACLDDNTAQAIQAANSTMTLTQPTGRCDTLGAGRSQQSRHQCLQGVASGKARNRTRTGRRRTAQAREHHAQPECHGGKCRSWHRMVEIRAADHAAPVVECADQAYLRTQGKDAQLHSICCKPDCQHRERMQEPTPTTSRRLLQPKFRQERCHEVHLRVTGRASPSHRYASLAPGHTKKVESKEHAKQNVFAESDRVVGLAKKTGPPSKGVRGRAGAPRNGQKSRPEGGIGAKDLKAQPTKICTLRHSLALYSSCLCAAA